MLRLDQLQQEHIDQVQTFVQWEVDKDKVVRGLLEDLHPLRWVGIGLPDGMLREFNTDRDIYIEVALQFLSEMRSRLVDFRDLGEPYRGAYATELHHREGLYLVAQVANMFFHHADSRYWCLQLYNERSLQIVHSAPRIPWDDNCWIFGLKESGENEFSSPVLASLYFMDGIRFLEDGETVHLKSRDHKLSAVVDNQRGTGRTLTATQYARFEPVMAWVGALYRGFPRRAIREAPLQNREVAQLTTFKTISRTVEPRV
jgi:hypothetical protein